MNTLEQLTSALLDYLDSVSQAQEVTPITQEPKPELPSYCGQAFQFHLGQCGELKVTALMAGIEKVWGRVYRYTSQKSRFIANKEGATNTDLYTFSPDEKDLYTQFLLEAADRISKLFLPYTKKLPFKGYLFNEGVSITEATEESVKLQNWAALSFVRVGKIYRAIQDVPVNTEITNEEYWEQVSELYDTKGKVAYFIDTELPQNAALNCLQAVENYLYSFVLWRWYTMAGQIDEAQVWNASFTASADDIKSSLLVRTTPIRRPMHPW